MKRSRQSILDRLVSRVVPPVPLPHVDSDRLVQYDDLVEQFSRVLQSVGGNVHRVVSAADVADVLAGQATFDAAGRIASLVPEAVAGTVDLHAVDDPHHLADLDWSVAQGAFGVAENGAIWVDQTPLPHRVMLFIPQHLALILPAASLVPHMHAAYGRLGTLGRGAGVFISGPSKTADIEQSLVIGAHGCRSLHVFLTG